MPTHQNTHPFHQPRVLITAGPTREPIDDVRFLGNRSSGALGIELARASIEAGLDTRLALGESVHSPNIEPDRVIRFDRTSELRELLRSEMPTVDLLIMAAAVADHTPAETFSGKLARSSDPPPVIRLVPTPDLLAETAASARPDQLLVGFALEQPEGLLQAAERKLAAKGVDIIVGNPLGTMESEDITPIIASVPRFRQAFLPPPSPGSKSAFAGWLLPRLIECLEIKASS